MRPTIYVAAVLALFAFAPETARLVLVAAAGILIESLPYLAAAAALRPRLGRHAPALLAYAGCGCTPGPSARSLPAALACTLLFGPWVALGRVALGTLAARLPSPHACEHEHADDLAAELLGLAPAALLAAGVLAAAPLLDLGHRPAALAILAGAALGLGAGPCALGTVALAATLRTQSPLAAFAALACGGMVDLRRFAPRLPRAPGGGLAYALLACVCGLVALRHGGGIVHPRLVLPLGACAVLCVAAALRARRAERPHAAIVAAALLAAVVVGAPLPVYRASETTLADAFAGEHLRFTGVYHAQPHAALVRFAITCCRADAHPVAALLASPVHARDRTWLRVRGVLARRGDALVLVPSHVQAIAPPSDPFVYE